MATDKILVKIAKNAELKISEGTTIVKKIVAGTPIKSVHPAAVNAGTLDGQTGSFFLNFNNFTNIPTILDSSEVLALVETQDIDNMKDSGTGVSILGPVKVSDHIIPDSDEKIDLGSPSKKFRSLFLTGGTLFVGNLAISDSAGILSLSDADSSGNIIAGTTRVIAVGSGLEEQTKDLDSAGTNQVIDSFSATAFRSCKYLVQLEHDSDSKYHTQEILLTHNGTNVFLTEYAEVKTDSSLGTFDANIVGGNVTLTLSPSFTNTDFKSKRISVSA